MVKIKNVYNGSYDEMKEISFRRLKTNVLMWYNNEEMESSTALIIQGA